MSRTIVFSLLILSVFSSCLFAQSGTSRSTLTLTVEIPARFEVRDAAIRFKPVTGEEGVFSSTWQTVAYANAHWGADILLMPMQRADGLSLLPVATEYRVEIEVNGAVQTRQIVVPASDRPLSHLLSQMPVPHDGVIRMRFTAHPVEATEKTAQMPDSPAFTFSVSAF